MGFVRRFAKSGAMAIALVVALVTGVAAGGPLFSTDLGAVTIVGLPPSSVLQVVKSTVGTVSHTVKPGEMVTTVDLIIQNTSKDEQGSFFVLLAPGKGAGFGMVVAKADFPFSGAGTIPPPPTWTDVAGPIVVKPGATLYVKVGVYALSDAMPVNVKSLTLTLDETLQETNPKG